MNFYASTRLPDFANSFSSNVAVSSCLFLKRGWICSFFAFSLSSLRKLPINEKTNCPVMRSRRDILERNERITVTRSVSTAEIYQIRHRSRAANVPNVTFDGQIVKNKHNRQANQLEKTTVGKHNQEINRR